jgi:hypothetical protein
MSMKKCFVVILCIFLSGLTQAQMQVDTKGFQSGKAVSVKKSGEQLTLDWPAGGNKKGKIVLDLKPGSPLFKSMGIQNGARFSEVSSGLDPVFIVTIGKRDLVSQNGWNIFFDKVPQKPFKAHKATLEKTAASIRTLGTRTVVTIGKITAADFSGDLEITVFNESPLINIAAVMSTNTDSTAVVFDAGLQTKTMSWKEISWSDVYGKVQHTNPTLNDTSMNEAVKYRTIMGSTDAGTLAVFPGPHQYFYPLDEAFNLKFTWHGNAYRKMTDGYGIGIRQDLYGDRRYVPWFNAPPGTKQRMNFFCLLSEAAPDVALNEVKRFTHNDTYQPLPGFKTMASHFHNEFIMNVVMANKPIPDTPSFIKVFRQSGIDMVHLGEFHYTAHPKGPDSTRLKELKALFDQCARLSNDKFLLMPGEEPNEFLGGHWLAIFPKPVYWIMARKADQPYVTEQPGYGKVYRIKDSTEMLRLLEQENGLAWTAHPRTKGSTGFPDKYKDASFFTSDRFLGGAWKAMPADLSQPRLGNRVLDLQDDMNNWGAKKKTIAEADLFTIEPENEMYAHMNINYMKMDKIPAFKSGWNQVLQAMNKGEFFSSTGEVLIPSFTVDGKSSGETVTISKGKKSQVSFRLNWTFPMQFAELISGDGKQVFREKIDLTNTTAFGEKTYSQSIDLTGKKWIRLEAWDAAVNGAFTQTIWIQ